MADRDCYWNGSSNTKWDDQDNWEDVNGDPLGGRPGQFASSPNAPDYDDRVFLLGARCANAPTTKDFGGPVVITRGIYMDAAFRTANPAATLDLDSFFYVLGGECDLGCSIIYKPYEDAAYERAIATLRLHDSAGMALSVVYGEYFPVDIEVYSGTHLLGMLAVGGNTLLGFTGSLKLMNLDAIIVPKTTGGTPTISIDPTAEDKYLPDASDIRAGVTCGYGTQVIGTLAVPASYAAGMARLGHECKLYRNAGTYDVVDWQEIQPVRDVTLNLEKGEVDATTRANGGWKATVGALKEGSVEFDIVWDPSDEGFQVLLDSYVNDTPVEIAVMDGYLAVPGSQGLRATMEVLKFTRVEGLEEAVVANVVVKPTLADHAPEWLVVPE